MQVRSTTTALISAAASLVIAGCATTESPKPAAQSAPAPAAAPAIKMLSAGEIAMSDILDNPKKLAVLQKHAPALAGNSQIGMARGMTLADVAGYAEAGLSEQMVKAICEDISKL